ncbi:MAG TPA: immunoglobulin domain-containing protein [Candidatus Limnocylindria bacterium]|nr:immunoglobulin domain-containing protein [Candidatus Limnocylindria bacterium]
MGKLRTIAVTLLLFRHLRIAANGFHPLLLLWLAFTITSLSQATLPASRDTTFQTVGMDGLPNTTVVLPSGKILIAGNFQNIGGTLRPGVARLDADGTLDESFAPPIAANKPSVMGLALLPNGQFVAAGQFFSTTGTTARTNIIRFNEDGTVDPGFNAGNINYVRGLAVQADGKVLYTSFVTVANSTFLAPVRLNADGSPDGGFAYKEGLYQGLGAVQLIAQSDGHTVVLAGDNNPSVGGIQHLLWLKADGSKDATFQFPFPPNQLQDDSFVAVAPDGRMLVANFNGSLIRQVQLLGANGLANPSFIVSTDTSVQPALAVPAAFLPDGGAIIVRNPTARARTVAFFYLTADGKVAAERDLPNAAIDNGVVGVGTLMTRAFAMQSDGKLLFAQAFQDGFQNTFGMFRLPPPPVPALPLITVQPQTKTIGAGEGLFLTVTATSDSPMTYQWQHATTNLPFQTAQSLSLGQNSLERAGDFQVQVGNAFGTSTSQVATVTIRLPAAPIISQQPVGGSVNLSQAYSLTCQCTTEVTTGYQWYKNNTPVPAGAGQNFGFAAINLPANDPTRSGDYFVTFTNSFGGSATSSVVHLEVILPGPPRFTAQPTDLDLFGAQPVQLNSTATGDGLITYRWQHSGTNLSTSATIPSVTNPGLYINGTDANRFGDYAIIASINGLTSTSRVAHVNLLPPGPPIVLTQPIAFKAAMGQPTNLFVGFNGQAPLTVFLQHSGTNLYYSGASPGLLYSVLDGPTTNSYFFNALPAVSGDYLFIITNAFGSVTSHLASVTVDLPAPASLLADLTNTVVGVGEFNFVALRQGLVATNFGSAETTHLLAFRVDSGLPPFRGTGQWQLALGTSNLYYVGENTGAAAARGTWGFAPAADNYVALSLTNFPGPGNVSRLEVLEDGRFGAILGDTTQVQNGTYRVLGQRRPATNIFTLDIVGSNTVSVAWFKDGLPLDFKKRAYTTTSTPLGAPPVPGGINLRLRLAIPDVQPGDVGTYIAYITNLFPNPDKNPGQPAYLVTSFNPSSPAKLSLRGYSETNAPAVVDAFTLSGPTTRDEPTALAILEDNSVLLGIHNGGDALGRFTPEGKVLWQTTGMPSQIRAVVSDGQGGAVLGGHNNDAGDWFLNRVGPTVFVSGGRTNFTATNIWVATVEGPSTNYFENAAIPHGAEVAGLIGTPDGVLVAGRFRGYSRFGATKIPITGGLYTPVGGVTLTNLYDSAFGRDDRSWDLYLAKYDLAGKLLWIHNYGGTNDDKLASFTTDGAGNLFLAGSFSGVASFGPVTLTSTKRVDSPTQTFYATDGFVAKLAPDGTPIWVRNFGGPSNGFLANTEIPSAAVDPLGYIYFVAARNQVAVTLETGMAVGSRYLARLNPAGDLQWAQTLETVGNADSLSGVGNCRLALDAEGNVALADAYSTSSPSQPINLGAAAVERRPAAGTLLAKFASTGTLLWARALDEKLPFSDDSRAANTRLLAYSPAGELLAVGSLPGGTSSAGSHTAGQRMDGFELATTDSGVVNTSDVFMAWLAPAYIPAPPVLAVTPVSQTGLLQDSLTLSAQVTGYPVPTFQWLFNDQPLIGATNRLLTFADLERTNRGDYVLVASNAYGVVRSTPVTVNPLLRPNMTGWSMVAATTNYLGAPAKIGVDDAGNAYVLLIGYANGGVLELRQFDVAGNYRWRFNDAPAPGIIYILSAISPVVAGSGEVFVAGRVIIQPDRFNRSEGNFIARLNPVDGAILWSRNLGGVGVGQIDPAVVGTLDLDGNGHVRALMTDKIVRAFAYDGTEVPAVTLAFLPTVKTAQNARYALDRKGGVYFYANRIESLNLGNTNLPALGNAGNQTYALARYDSGGVLQWLQSFTAPTGLGYSPSLNVDPSGNLIVSGGLSLSLGQTFTMGTNQLSGTGYAAKLTPAGDVVWAKAWWLNIRDTAVGADGSIYLTGWFRFAPSAATGYTRQITFGTNIVAGSSPTGHDQFVARLDTDGHEQFIRQTGSPDFSTFDNAVPYTLAVDSHGIVTTAGFTLVKHAGGGLDLGNLRYTWPNLVPFDFANSGGDLSCYYVARLEVDLIPDAPPEITFTPPSPGATSLRLDWPAGYHLQHRTTLFNGDWGNLDVQPPYQADLSATVQGYFRIVR